MNLFHLPTKYPVIAYVLFCVAFGLLASGTASLGSYDDGGIGFIGILLMVVWAVVAFPFSIPMELAGSGLGRLIGMAIGLFLCLLAEIVVQLVRRHFA